MTEFFYQSDVKEASGMLNIHLGLAPIDTLDLIERHLVKKQEYYSPEGKPRWASFLKAFDKTKGQLPVQLQESKIQTEKTLKGSEKR